MNTQNTPAIVAKSFARMKVRALVIGDNIWMHCTDVVMDCRAPKAKEFGVWVATEFVPFIRKTGQYSVRQDSPSTEAEVTTLLLDAVDNAAVQMTMLAETTRNVLAEKAELATQLGYNGYYTQAQIRECNRWMGSSKVHIALNVLSAKMGFAVRLTQNYGTAVQHNMYAVEVWKEYADSVNQTLTLPQLAKEYVEQPALALAPAPVLAQKPKPVQYASTSLTAKMSPETRALLRSKLPVSPIRSTVH